MFVIYNIRTTGDFVRPGIWLGQGLGLGLGLDNNNGRFSDLDSPLNLSSLT